MNFQKSLSLLVASVFASCTMLAADAQTNAQATPSTAVKAFYTFHLAHDMGYTLKNLLARKRFVSPELYGLLAKELNRQAEYSKKHPDEAPDFEGDPFTDSQEYPNSFRVSSTVTNGNRAKVTVSLIWKLTQGQGTDNRNIMVEVVKSGTSWLIDDVVNNEGSSLRAELTKPKQ